jgi:hypothetical protein
MLPLLCRPGYRHHQCMTNIQTFQGTPQRRTDTLLARVKAGSLDAQLASGRPPEQTRLLTVRAAKLVTSPSREALAAWWVEVVSRALHQQQPTATRVPVSSARILAAEAAIRDLVDALQSPEPVAARGVAEARLLLRDGTGPVYNTRSSRDLATAVRVAFQHLETRQSSWSRAA